MIWELKILCTIVYKGVNDFRYLVQYESSRFFYNSNDLKSFWTIHSLFSEKKIPSISGIHHFANRRYLYNANIPNLTLT